MRIAIIASPYCPIPPEKYGGSEVMIDCLARGLHAAGHDVELVALEGSTCPVPTRFVDPGSQPHAFSVLCHEISYVLGAYQGLADNFDVVHDHTTLGPAYARAFPSLPLIVTNHGPFEGVLNSIYEKEASWVDTFVAISAAQAANAPMPTTVIHHGTDTERFAFGEGKGDDKGEYVLFLGRMQWIKGPQIAARAAREAGMRLVIAAKMQEPPEFEFFEKEVEPLLGDDVEFVGEVGGQVKTDLLRNARALLNPIQWPEPFGLAMIEAFSCGTPVIALNFGSVPEIVDHGTTGFICDSELELPSALSKLDEIDRQACRSRATEYFNYDRMAADYVKVYQQAIENRRSRT